MTTYNYNPDHIPEDQEFLTKAGYKLWCTEQDEHGFKYKWQARIDWRVDFDGSIPLCNLNEKLHINVSIHDWLVNGHELKGAEIELCHENQFGEWTSTKIYSLLIPDLELKLHSLESKLLRMWKEFNWE